MKFGLFYEMETPRPWNALSEYIIVASIVN